MGRPLRGMALGCVLVLCVCGSAFGASGTRVLLGTPFENGPPSVGVDASGTAYIAWANTKHLAGSNDFIQYCVIPAGAKACFHSGNLIPADGLQFVDGVHVLIDGSTVVILADVFGSTPGNQDFSPVQEWQSTNGGATFTVVNGGMSVTAGFPSADKRPLNAVIVPGTNVLGFGWDTAGTIGPPSFNAFPLTSPPECSNASPCPHATLEPSTNPDQLQNQPGEFASQFGPNPGVLGIFFTDFTNGPLGCSNTKTVPFGMAYAYGSGPQSAGNDYNLSPGQPNSAWKVPLSLADCNVDYQAVAGGPSGFGVLETDELRGTTVYHPFDGAHMNFDTARYLVSNTKQQSPSLSQDGAGGIYATFLVSGPGSPITVSYSSNGGRTWLGPTTLDPNGDQNDSDVTSVVGPVGQGWAAWSDNGSIYARQFTASDALPPATTLTTIQTAGARSGANLTIPAGTIGETDQATVRGRNAATASGTMTYSLYAKASCASGLVSHSTTTVSASVAGASAPVTKALSPGTYYWQASYRGDSSDAAATSSCGAEKLTVSPAASVGSTATSTTKAITVKVGCAHVPCTVMITITTRSGGKTIKLASGTVTLRKKGSHKVNLRLTRAGKRFRKTHRGTVKGKIVVLDRVHGHVITMTRKLRIKRH